MNTIAAIGVALHEAAQPAFKDYARRVVENARALADALKRRGFKLVTDGTDNHLLLIDLTTIGVGLGAYYHLALERVGLYANKNTIPNDPSSPFYPSGLRIGTPAATTRGMGANEMEMIANWIAKVSEKIKDQQLPTEKEQRIAAFKEFAQTLTTDPYYEKLQKEVMEMCVKFQVPALS